MIRILHIAISSCKSELVSASYNGMVSSLTSSLELGSSGGKFFFNCFRDLALEVAELLLGRVPLFWHEGTFKLELLMDVYTVLNPRLPCFEVRALTEGISSPSESDRMGLGRIIVF